MKRSIILSLAVLMTPLVEAHVPLSALHEKCQTLHALCKEIQEHIKAARFVEEGRVEQAKKFSTGLGLCCQAGINQALMMGSYLVGKGFFTLLRMGGLEPVSLQGRVAWSLIPLSVGVLVLKTTAIGGKYFEFVQNTYEATAEPYRQALQRQLVLEEAEQAVARLQEALQEPSVMSAEEEPQLDYLYERLGAVYHDLEEAVNFNRYEDFIVLQGSIGELRKMNDGCCHMSSNKNL